MRSALKSKQKSYSGIGVVHCPTRSGLTVDLLYRLQPGVSQTENIFWPLFRRPKPRKKCILSKSSIEWTTVNTTTCSIGLIACRLVQSPCYIVPSKAMVLWWSTIQVKIYSTRFVVVSTESGKRKRRVGRRIPPPDSMILTWSAVLKWTTWNVGIHSSEYRQKTT